MGRAGIRNSINFQRLSESIRFGLSSTLFQTMNWAVYGLATRDRRVGLLDRSYESDGDATTCKQCLSCCLGFIVRRQWPNMLKCRPASVWTPEWSEGTRGPSPC